MQDEGLRLADRALSANAADMSPAALGGKGVSQQAACVRLLQLTGACTCSGKLSPAQHRCQQRQHGCGWLCMLILLQQLSSARRACAGHERHMVCR